MFSNNDKNVIIGKVKDHFTTIVAGWIKTAVPQVHYPDKKKRSSSTQLGVAKCALVRGLFTYKAIIRKRCTRRYEAAVDMIQGYKATLLESADSNVRQSLDRLVSEITRHGNLSPSRKSK